MLPDPRYVTFLPCCVTGTRLKPAPELGSPVSASVDLSKATKLKKVTFRSCESSVAWITEALRTITPEHEDFREVSIHIHFGWIQPLIRAPFDTQQIVGTEVDRQWDLDELLIRLGESHGVVVMVKYYSDKKKEALRLIKRMLPKITNRGGTTLDHADPD